MSPMTHEETDVLARAHRLVRAATGEEYGDGSMVTDVGYGIAEPGYSPDAVWALGNWNPKRWWRDGDPPLTLDESRPVRLADALEKQGVVCHWLDEWTVCYGCMRIVRTEPDSYSWQPSYYWFEDGDLMCQECAKQAMDDLLDDHINKPEKALTFVTANELIEEGFEKYNGTYRSGWYPPDQTHANPKELYDTHSSAWEEIVFRLGYVRQFDLGFEMWLRTPVEPEEEIE